MVEIKFKEGGIVMKVPCEVIQDLIPLVKDHVASEESKKLVVEHLEDCTRCGEIFENDISSQDELEDDKKIISKIESKLFIVMLSLSLFGILVGLFMNSDSSLNLVLTIVGLLSFLAIGLVILKFKKKGDDPTRKFFIGKAIGTLILFSLIIIYFIGKYLINIF